MPTMTAGEITTVRSHPHYVRKYLSVNPKNSVYTGQLDGSISFDKTSGGVYAFGYGSGSGTLSDVENDMLIEIGTTPGANDIGRARIRKAPTASVIYINEIAYGELPIELNHYFTIYELFLPDVKMLRLKGVKKNGAQFFNNFIEYHDYDIEYVNQNHYIEPKANITEQNADVDRKKFPIKFSGWVDDYFTDSPQTYRTVTLSAAESFAIADGANLITTPYSWDVKDGTITVGTSADEDITVQFPVGFRYIKLTVTDSNGTSAVRRVPIWVHDDTYPPIGNITGSTLERGFIIERDQTKQGRSMSFRVIGETNSATETEIPAGTEICYWEEAEFDGSAPPDMYRATFLGWALEDSTDVKQQGGYRVDVGGIEAWLKKLIGFGTQITDKNRTPRKWFEMENISADKMVHYLLREYTTVIPLVNLYFSGISKNIQAETAKRSSVWRQCSEIMQAHFAMIMADSANGLWLRKHPSYPLDEDPTPDNILQISPDDWTDNTTITVVERQFDPIGRVDGTGAFWTPGATEPVVLASRAPGKVVGRSSGTESTPFQRLQGGESNAQSDLNQLTGHHFARRNAKIPELSLTLIGNYDIFEPAWMETVTLIYTEDSIRDVGFTGSEKFLVTSVTVNHSEQVGSIAKAVKLRLEPVTEGEPGVTIVIPTGDWIDNPFWDLYFDVSPLLPDFDFPDLDFNSALNYTYEGEITGFAVLPVEEKYVARSFSFGSENVTYDDITPDFGESGQELWTLAGIACQYGGSNVTCRAVYWKDTTARIYLTTAAEASDPTWVLEDTFTISGGTFNGAMTIRASDDPTEDLWAINWLMSDGVYQTRRYAGSWQSSEVIGSSAFADTNWTDKKIGLYINGDQIYSGGRTAAGKYSVYTATGLGAYSIISGTSSIFDNAVCDIVASLNGDVYAAAYGDDISYSGSSLVDTAAEILSEWGATITSQWVDMPYTPPIESALGDGFNNAISDYTYISQWNLTEGAMNEPTSRDVSFELLIVPSTTITIDDVSNMTLHVIEEDVTETSNSASDIVITLLYNIRIYVTLTIFTENYGTIVSETYDYTSTGPGNAAVSSEYDVVEAGFDSDFTARQVNSSSDWDDPSGLGTDLNPDSPSVASGNYIGETPFPPRMEVTGFKYTFRFENYEDSTPEIVAPFRRHTGCAAPDDNIIPTPITPIQYQTYPYFAFGDFSFTTTVSSDITKSTSKLIHIDDPLGTPVVSNITPPTNYEQGVPSRPGQIAPDWGDDGRLHIIGTIDRTYESSPYQREYESFNQGGTWQLGLTTFSNWKKLHGNIELYGSHNELVLELSNNANDRLGNLDSLYGTDTPDIGLPFVLFAG